jgi:hypothetical protein
VNAPEGKLAWVDSEEGVIGGYWTDDVLTVQDALQHNRRVLIIDREGDTPHVHVPFGYATQADLLSLAVWLREHDDRLFNMENFFREIGQQWSDTVDDAETKRR